MLLEPQRPEAGDSSDGSAVSRALVFIGLPMGSVRCAMYRDAGLVYRGFAARSASARLVAFESEGVDPEPHLLMGSFETLSDPQWWIAQRPSMVVFHGWGKSKLDPIREAAMASTPRFIERLDSSGLRSPRVGFLEYNYVAWARMHDVRKKRLKHRVPWFSATARSMAEMFFPVIRDRPMAAIFAKVPVLAAESPIAVERIRRFLRDFGHDGLNVHLVPHPVDTDPLAEVGPGPREDVVLCVGRWETHQKNFPLLLSVLTRFLAAHPGWRAEIIGGLGPSQEGRLCSLPRVVASRVSHLGYLDRSSLYSRMDRAKIQLVTSRHESFHIAAAEGLCSGCSVVAPPHLASMSWFCSANSGTLATRYSAAALCDALATEAALWDAGGRNPADIASVWRARTGYAGVTDRLMRLADGCEIALGRGSL